MLRPLQYIEGLAEYFCCPIICCGDIFDKWKCYPELINFAIENLPTMYAIPGNHDLPFHSLKEIERSAFHTLVKAGKIIPLDHRACTRISDKLWVWAFPWEVPLKRKTQKEKIPDGVVKLAVAHKYVWVKGKAHPQVNDSSHLLKVVKKLRGFDAVAFGDNHKFFHRRIKSLGMDAINCGTLMRRKMDEKDYTPTVGVLLDDASIVPHEIQWTDLDRFITPSEVLKTQTPAEIEEFLTEFTKIADNALNLLDYVNQWCNRHKLSRNVRKILLDIFGEDE